MTMLVRKGGAWRTITAAKVFANGAWRSLVAIKVYKSGAWRTVANFTAPAPPPDSGGSGGGTGGGGGTLALSLSATTISGVGALNNTAVTSSSVTVTPSGGLAPYTYLWSIVSDDGETYTVDDPTLATTTVTGTSLPLDTLNTCTIHCVVTDSLGTSATSDSVSVRLRTSSTL